MFRIPRSGIGAASAADGRVKQKIVGGPGPVGHVVGVEQEPLRDGRVPLGAADTRVPLYVSLQHLLEDHQPIPLHYRICYMDKTVTSTPLN